MAFRSAHTKLKVGADGSAFSPLSLSPAGWWDASALTGLSDTQSVTSWTDRSGNGRHLAQGTAGNQPAYRTAIQNALPVVRFDGSNDHVGATFTLAPPYTLFVVSAFRAAFVANAFVVSSPTLATGLFYRSSSTNMQQYSGSVGAVVTTTPEAWHAYTSEFNGASSTLRVDGGAAATGNPGAGVPGGVRVGTDNVGAQAATVDVGELLVYASILSAANRAAVEAYLKAKWGTP